jgi:hypothetical protein
MIDSRNSVIRERGERGERGEWREKREKERENVDERVKNELWSNNV